MKRGWIITLIVLFLLLLGGGAFLLLRYQRKINDREADLALLNDDIDKTAEQAEKFQQIAAKVRSGQVSAEEAERQIEAITNGEDSETNDTSTNKTDSKQAIAVNSSLDMDSLNAVKELKSVLQAKIGTKIIANGPKINLNDLK